MRHFTWSSAHSVYLGEIDAEHRELFRLGEEVEQGLNSGVDLVKLQPVLANLFHSVESHFKHEERLMHASHYSALAWHTKQHDAVRLRLRRLLAFLDEWLNTHTQVSDRMMGAYIRNFLRFNTALAS